MSDTTKLFRMLTWNHTFGPERSQRWGRASPSEVKHKKVAVLRAQLQDLNFKRISILFINWFILKVYIHILAPFIDLITPVFKTLPSQN